MMESVRDQKESSKRGMWLRLPALTLGVALAFIGPPGLTAGTDAASEANAEKSAERTAIEQLVQSNEVLAQEIQELRARLQEMDALKARLAELESQRPAAAKSVLNPSEPEYAAPPASGSEPVQPSAPPSPKPAETAGVPAPAAPPQGGHTMDLPYGPKLNIHGFLDFNLGFGSVANPLIYPLTIPPTPVHNAFQLGEFDLFIGSTLSNTLTFQSEVVLAADSSNFWGVDIERAQLTYKPNEYIVLTGGRMHTEIGYYNTAFHHGTWFQTATGRPYMYYFEDGGGILPVHMVGAEASGLIPHTGSWNAHWIAEVGNGESSLFIGQPIVNQPVQNFVSDKNHKAFNVAGFIKPEWARGLQIGVNYYNDKRVPTGIPHVNNSIAGAYLVYITPTWEFLNEFQLQRDRSVGSVTTYNTPLGFTQLSHKFGKFRPYFRWQEVNVPANDPLYGTVGRYEGPSPGLRIDLADFAAVKVQYNRIYTRNPQPMNGVDNQVSFTF
jgi:hypothetical protein